MDHFGIGAAVEGAVRVYFQSARQTGRTEAMLDNLKEGDRVYVATQPEARDLLLRCKERRLNVDIKVSDPRYPERIFEFGTPQGRAIFDHGWLEQYYLDAIANAQKSIEFRQIEASGHSKAHRETKRQAEEIAKWQIR